MRSNKGSTKRVRQSLERSNKNTSLNSTSKPTEPVKTRPRRPRNIDYLNNLAQPKSKGSYVLVKEDSSESDHEGNEQDEKQKQLK